MLKAQLLKHLLLSFNAFKPYEVMMRNLTDVIWSSIEKVRWWCRGDVRWLFYGVLIAYIIFACGWAIWQAQPLILLLISSNIANFSEHSMVYHY
ncbi:hypothetical protein DRO59_01435 [Candidatus Bathyarchaeota archaeon]|nr:MAG: hypothetical protein DRO59_01435 [Candidatus Bathyarchaeota archaeon]